MVKEAVASAVSLEGFLMEESQEIKEGIFIKGNYLR
ncbi:hypothetical protein ES703_59784 [subsurface metagenome]